MRYTKTLLIRLNFVRQFIAYSFVEEEEEEQNDNNSKKVFIIKFI